MSDHVTMEHNFDDIINGMDKMGKDIKKTRSKITAVPANIIKEALKKNLGRSKANHMHMADDIKIGAVTIDDEENHVRIIKGGKRTHYKWKWLEFGTSKLKALLFITKSLNETEKAVEEAMTEEIRKVMEE